jgi:hypothetical protein
MSISTTVEYTPQSLWNGFFSCLISQIQTQSKKQEPSNLPQTISQRKKKSQAQTAKIENFEIEGGQKWRPSELVLWISAHLRTTLAKV